MARRADGDGAPPAHNDRFKLKDFKGEKGDSAASWLRKFIKIAARQGWNDERKCEMLDLHLDGAADTWFSALPEDKQNNWAQLEEAFREQFIAYEPPMVTQSRFSNRVWEVASESLDDYVDNLKSYAARLNATAEQLMIKFVQGLPSDYQNFVLSTDTHALQTYVTRAKLYHARRQIDPNSSNFGRPNVVAMVEQLTDSISSLQVEVNAIRSRGRYNDRRHSGSRERGSDRNSERSPARSYYRNRSRSFERRRDKSPNRNWQASERNGRQNSPDSRESRRGSRGRFDSSRRDSRSDSRDRKVRFRQDAGKIRSFKCGEVGHFQKGCAMGDDDLN